jgi:hypothetical protein
MPMMAISLKFTRSSAADESKLTDWQFIMKGRLAFLFAKSIGVARIRFEFVPSHGPVI